MARSIENGLEPGEGPQIWTKRLLQVVFVVGVLLVSFWLTASIVDLSLYEAYNHYIDNLRAHLGINSYLANALSLVFLAPFFIGVKYYLFSFRDRKRKQGVGMAMLLSMGVLYNLALYFGTQNEHFDSTGHSIKFYALIPGGVVFSDHAGIEPKYGMAFRPVTQENIKWLLRIQQGHVEAVIDAGHHDWFDGVTRDPLLWYYTDAGGDLHFYDGPGYAPSTGAELKPVTPQIRQRWDEKIRMASAEEARRDSSRAHQPDADAGSGPVSIRVDGNREWTNTGISLRLGEFVTVSATGLITVTRVGHIPYVPPIAPSGYPPDCTAAVVHGLLSHNRHPFPAFQLPCWSLIGRIGDQGPIFEIGAQAKFPVAMPGELYLGVNDEIVDDNAGYWIVEIGVRHRASGAVPSSTPPETPDTVPTVAEAGERPVAASLTREMDDITFVLNFCRFRGSSVFCSLQFFNRDRDREMRLGGQFGGTRIIDQSGREYTVQVLQLGVRECRGCAVVNKLVSDVPMSSGLTFGNVSADVSLISLLEINYSMDGGGRWSTVQFRDVPVLTDARR